MTDPKAPELTLADLEGLADYLLNPHAGTRQTYARFVCNDDMSALLAAARRDADVRTLDTWMARLPPEEHIPRDIRMVRVNDTWRIDLAFWRVHQIRGATPDEARSAAAAWVRSQSASPPGESK